MESKIESEVVSTENRGFLARNWRTILIGVAAVINFITGDMAWDRNAFQQLFEAFRLQRELPLPPQRELPISPQRELPIPPQGQLPIPPQGQLPIPPQRELQISPQRELLMPPQRELPIPPQRELPIPPQLEAPLPPQQEAPLPPQPRMLRRIYSNSVGSTCHIGRVHGTVRNVTNGSGSGFPPPTTAPLPEGFEAFDTVETGVGTKAFIDEALGEVINDSRGG